MVKMTAFELFEKNVVNIGIDRKQLTTKHAFNEESLKCFFVLGALAICSDLYFFHMTNDFRDYTESFYITSMSNSVFLVFSIAIWKMNALFQLIDDSQQIGLQSEQIQMIDEIECVKYEINHKIS